MKTMFCLLGLMLALLGQVSLAQTASLTDLKTGELIVWTVRYRQTICFDHAGLIRYRFKRKGTKIYYQTEYELKPNPLEKSKWKSLSSKQIQALSDFERGEYRSYRELYWPDYQVLEVELDYGPKTKRSLGPQLPQFLGYLPLTYRQG